MRVSVFGVGYVGAVSAACLANDGHRVVAVDTNKLKVDAVAAGRSPVAEPGLDALLRRGTEAGLLRATLDGAEAVAATDISFVCVGTPSLANGGLDLTFVARCCEEIGRALARKASFHAVVVRSTMLPGSAAAVVEPILERFSGKKAGKDFGVAVYPEFLREGTAIHDHYETGTVVFGAGDGRTLAMLREATATLRAREFALEPGAAEMVKYANNAWHATKVVFANEIGGICKSLGLDSHGVVEVLCSDTRLNVSPAYMRPGFAFGGSCLPKDMRALVHKARSLDVECPMLNAILPSNERQVRRAFEMVEAAGGRRVGLVGLTFKGGTDDLRESPAVELAERLFGKGYDLRIFDHNVCLSRLTGANLAFVQGRFPHLSSLLTDDLDAVARHAETLVVTQRDFGAGRALPPLREGQVMVDLVRLPGAERPSEGRYEGISW